MATLNYGADYFAWQRDTASASAHIVLPVVLDLVPAKSIIDVGCGTGAWLQAALGYDVEKIMGLDGSCPAELSIPDDCFQQTDLNDPISVTERYDLAICLEVAEHLRPSRGPGLVTDLCALAPVVLFSAAVPGQVDPPQQHLHPNERWHTYWADLFERSGYRAVDALRPVIWEDDRISWWYRQNAFLAVAPNVAVQGGPVRNEVHPEMWAAAKRDLWARDLSA